MPLEERKFSQTPVVEVIDPNDTVLLLTANGQNARATVAELAQQMSDSQVTKESLGLGNVDNTADVDKPISTATQEALTEVNTRIDNLPAGGVTQEEVDQSIATAIQPLATTVALNEGLAAKADVTALSAYATTESVTEALAGKADISALEGLASEAFVNNAISTIVDAAPESLNTLQELATALGDDANFAATVTNALATKASTQALEDGLATKADAEVVQDTFAKSVVFPSLLEFLDGHYPVFFNGEWTVGDSKHAKYVWVDSGKAPLFRDGSYEFPFAQIQEAVDAISSTPVAAVINVVAGSTNYAGFTINNLLNLQIQGFGLNDAQQVKIVGEVVYTGAGCTRVKMKDLQIQSSAVDKSAFTVDGTQGRHYFENVTLSKFSGAQSVPVFDLKGNFSNWIDCFNCNFSGIVGLGGTPAANALFATRGGNDDGLKIIQTAAMNIVVNNHSRMGYIEHIGGNLSVTNAQHWTGQGGVAIKSTAPAAAGSSVSVLYSDFLADNGSWLKIDKEGDCVFRLGFVNRNPQIDVLMGTRVAVGGSSEDLQANYEGVNYTAPVTASVHDHLAGIDGSMIGKDTLKSIAASSADFDAFKAAIGAL